MNKNLIKNFALNLRKQLIYGINKKSKQVEINEPVEEIAYEWYIRLITIRFMQVNKYIDCNLNNKLFNKYDFLNISNYLSEIMPEVFKKVENNMYLLLPDNICGENSIVDYLVNGIDMCYWKDELTSEEKSLNKEIHNLDELEYGVEIIGWLHQYFYSERKEEIFSVLKKEKLTKQNISAATQIFTPKWIVKYMVQNSLGEMWLESNFNQNLRSKWTYIIENESEKRSIKEKLKDFKNPSLKPEEIKILDPAMGSGHILVYAFDVLYDIYYSLGYLKQEIPILILKNNLYGLDIDDKVGKLAILALLMKSRSKNKHIFKYKFNLNLVTIQESNEILTEAIDFFINVVDPNDENYIFQSDVKYLIHMFKDAKEYGALLNVKHINFDLIERGINKVKKLDKLNSNYNFYKKIILEKIPVLIKQAKIMCRKYDIVIANPPYSGIRRLNKSLKEFVQEYYSDYKYDLFSAFIVKNMNFTKKNGFASFMTPNVWQYISSYEKLRNYIIDNYCIMSLIQLDDYEFKYASVSISTFVIRKFDLDIKSIFIKLNDINIQCAESLKNNIIQNSKNKFLINKDDFKKIPGSKIAFWFKESTIQTFENGKSLEKIGKPRQGMATSNNAKFIRYWYEVDFNKICFLNQTYYDTNYKWIPYNKGGGCRKWYGNNSFVVNWENNGREIKSLAENLYNNYTRTIKNEKFYFKQGITYTFIGKEISPRFSPNGFIFDVGGSMVFVPKDKLYYVLGLLASKVSDHYIKILNPSLNIQVGDIKSIPIIEAEDTKCLSEINSLVQKNINIAKDDWDSFETSWDFKKHPLVKYKYNCKRIEVSYKNWESYTITRFDEVKKNEKRINNIFINIYGLDKESIEDIKDKDITIRKANEIREIKSFISYAVGCMFGRYSLDEEGVVFAGGIFKNKFKFEKGICLVKSKECWKKSSIKIIENNIISIKENGYTKHNIVDCFIDFVKVVFGKETLDENLNYISSVLYRNTTKNPRKNIEKYFVNHFFSDHLKTYQNRPIYWVVNEYKGIKSEFLIYIHRHKEIHINNIHNMNLDDGIKENYDKYILRR